MNILGAPTRVAGPEPAQPLHSTRRRRPPDPKLFGAHNQTREAENFGRPRENLAASVTAQGCHGALREPTLPCPSSPRTLGSGSRHPKTRDPATSAP